MEDFRILDPDLDPDPYNNATGSASLILVAFDLDIEDKVPMQ